MSQQRSLSQTNLASANFQYSTHSLKGRSPSLKSQSSLPASQPNWEHQAITHNGSTSWKRGHSCKERNPQPPSVSQRPALSRRSLSVSQMEISPASAIQQHQSYISMERAVCNASASVMIYDNPNKKWVQAGNSDGFSRVQIFHHAQNNSYRVVGRLKSDQSVVINSSIMKGLRYNEATPSFHQWRDSRQVYGLNFQTEDDAHTFAEAMKSALDALSAPSRPPPASVPPQPPSQGPPHQNGPSIQEDIRTRPAETQNQRSYSSSSEPPASSVSRTSPEAPAVPSSAPPAPPAPPAQPPPAPAAPPVPPGPPPPPSGGGPPPPPPPPPPPTQSGGGSSGGSGLAGALQAAKLKKVSQDDSAGGGDSGSAPKPRGGGGMVDMMSEMQMRLKKRQQVQTNNDEGKSGRTSPPNQNKEVARKPWEKTPAPVANRPKANGLSSVDGNNSPLTNRRRGSFQKESNNANASDSDLEKLKQEILTEMRKEMQKMKAEIIDAIKNELGKS